MNLQASIRIPRRARDGDTGKGISEVKDFYGLSSSETSEPTEWFSYIPNKPADKYLWNYEKIIYTDGTSTDTKKRVIQGKDARSIESVVNAYAYSASDTVSPTSGWMSTIESLGVKPIGYFLWVRDDITYTDGTSSSTAGYVVKEGTDGYSVTLSKDSHTYTYDKDGNLKGPLSNGATTISVQRGDIFFKCDTTSIGLTPVANNTYRVVAIEVDGVSHSGASRTLVNNELKIWPSAFAGEIGSMTFTIRAMSDGVVSKDFKKTISFSKNKDGADGKEGTDGKDGIDGLPGIPGQVPFIKEWVVGDTHRNTDEIVDFIYVRGRDKQTSYYYKKTNKGSSVAETPPSGGEARAGYERVDWLKELAVQVLIAEEANIANFIYKDEKLLSMRGKTFAGLEILYGEYTEYEFTNRTTQPSVGSSYWTNLPEGTTRFIRFKKNTENDWIVKEIGTYGDRWTVQYADRPDASSWDNSFATGKVWMQIKEAGEQDFRDAVKIDVSDGYDFIPNLILDGKEGDVKISGEISATSGKVGYLDIDAGGSLILKDEEGETRLLITKGDVTPIADIGSKVQNSTVNNSLLGIQYMLSGGVDNYAQGNKMLIKNNNTHLTISTSIEISISTRSGFKQSQGRGRVRVWLKKIGFPDNNILLGEPDFIQVDKLSGEPSVDSTGVIAISKSMLIDTGTYEIAAEVWMEATAGDHHLYTLQGTLGASTMVARFDAANRRTEIGKNGIGIIVDANNYMCVVKEGNGFKVIARTNGVFDMPGSLLSATVASGGGWSNVWGAKTKTSTGSNVSLAVKNSTGRYTVYHSLGHSRYQVFASAHAANRSHHIVSKGDTSFIIEWRTIGSSPSLADTAFDVKMVGDNY